jgi:hypothetical protein
MIKTQAKEIIEELVERFDYHIDEYKKGSYNETQTRNDFINPFFESLGWDINNRQGLAESYREVIHEDKIKISGSTKAPDYCFTIYGQRKFFLEAKKPSVDIKDQIDPAYQLRRYGWSAKMPISIITDFEELSIYDCTTKPFPTDKASVSRIKYITYKDYIKEFDFIWDIFSKDMILKGSFDKYVASAKGKKGTAGVDEEFLKSLDSWRDLLARNIVNRNNFIGEDELNYSLQKIMDRIIFLRICEDRGVETEYQLQKIIGTNIYDKLKYIFHTADQKYNSGLFDYKKDTISDNLLIDDKVLKQIIEEMYYPKSPYEFSVIPVEIMGHSYEQYLGKVIRITPGHRIKIEEKPEVRKAGGVYYTPQYIVDYIVRNTVGKLLGDRYQVSGDGCKVIGDGYQVLGDSGRVSSDEFIDLKIESDNNKLEKLENGSEKGNQNISGFGSLEISDGHNSRNIQDYKGVPEAGDLRINESNSEISSFNTGEYSGGAGKDPYQGIHKSSVDSKGFTDRTGNTSDFISETGIHRQGEINSNLEQSSKYRKNVESTYKGSPVSKDSEKITQHPAPETRNLSPDTCNPLTPDEVAKLKFCDPACGSGSFLIGAYQYLLDWHREYYTNADIKHKDKYLNPDGSLTTQLKKQILLNNIYGVDIDTNAVEVTKLSLMLKALEGETEATINNQLTLLHERVLPTLDNNIKSGNSLIDVDFYDNQIDFEPGAEKKIKPFNWESNFPEVFKQGGFDVVIGNPPWGANIEIHSLNYIKNSFQKIIVRMIDSFMFFTNKSYNILKLKGIFGMILPDVILYQYDNFKLREFLLNNTTIKRILNVGDVFEKVIRPTSIIIFEKYQNEGQNIITVLNLTDKKKEEKSIYLENNDNYEDILQNDLFKTNNYLFITKDFSNYQLLEKISKNEICKLSQYVDDDRIQRGASPDLKEAFIVNTLQIQENKLEETYLRNVVTGGKHVKRYYIENPDLKLIYLRRNDNISEIPNIKSFIDKFKSKITCKEVIENKHSLYSLHRAREEKIYLKNEKLLGVITEDEIIVTLDSNQLFATDGLYLFAVKNINIKYLMSILNSKLFVFVYRLISMENSRVLAQVKPKVIDNLPIKVINFSNLNEQTIHDQLVTLVDQMLKLNKDLQAATLPEQKDQLKARIDYTDKKIDKLVYELYGLTEEEIKIVEGN